MSEEIPDKSRWLIIPMEIIDRELSGALLLASEAVSRGWQCIIGTKYTISHLVNDLPKGAVFLKSIVASDEAAIRIYKKAGNIVVSQDIEGFIYATMDEFVNVRFSSKTLALTEKVFFWGGIQHNAIAEAYPEHKEKFFTTGSHTADLWHRKELHSLFSEEAEKIKARFGDYILLPSSFGSVNHYLGKGANLKMILREKMIADDKKDEFSAYWLDYEDFLEKIFLSYTDLLPDLAAAFPDRHIVVRPHPSENHEPWKEAAKGLPNVSVIFEGTVSPWLLGADAILHWGCTTGVEGHLLGRPVVTYDSVSTPADKDFVNTIPDSVSIRAKTKEDTISVLRDIVDRPQGWVKRYPELKNANDLLSQWLLIDDNDFAEKNIIDEIEKISFPEDTLTPLPKKIKLSAKERIWYLIQIFDRLMPIFRPLYPAKIKYGLEARDYGR
jgi:surface carbohydrate biosynthesis protein